MTIDFLKQKISDMKDITQEQLAQLKKIAKQEAKKRAETFFSNKMVNHTKHYQKKYEFDMGKNNDLTWNNEGDAFKHTYMQAFLTVFSSEEIAQKLGDMHENDGKDRNQPSGEENMDLWNNNQGRKIGLEVTNELFNEYGYNINYFELYPTIKNMIAKKVHQRMKAGKLITNPNDKRRYVPKNKSATTTGQDAPISSSISSDSVTQPKLQNQSSKTSSQNFSDIIRQKYKSQQSENNKKFNRIFKSHNTSTPTGSGHWVTINGAHIFIED